MQFLVSDYFATGEGNTICLLVTKAYPKQEDWEVKPKISRKDDGTLEFTEGKYSEKLVAAKEFIEQFGSYYAQGAKNISKEEFFKKYQKYLPSFLEKVVEEGAGNINYSMKLHLNFS